ncbi:hypothetical protein H0H92_007509 [Tricholoma furcatifolium]|nr:hypothetical protein H0H92_007509 [Tricholoma furcatifolium]
MSHFSSSDSSDTKAKEKQAAVDVQHIENRDSFPSQDINNQHDPYPPDDGYVDAWTRYRSPLVREVVAEFLGTFILVIFGNSVNAQVQLSSNPNVAGGPRGDWTSLSLGWGAGLALGGWVSGGFSGGHINPAVTLAMAVYRRFPWKKVPLYMTAQLFGGIMGAAFTYWTYFHAINIYEGGRGIRTLKTAGIFATYALDYMSSVSCFFQEFLGAAILVLVVFAITDKGNSPPPPGMAPIVLFFLLMGLAAGNGMQTSFAFNPARDFGPRLFTSMIGYGKAVYTYRHQYWIWCPIMGDFLGGLCGAGFYDLFLYTGEDGIFNRMFGRSHRNRARAAAARPGQIPPVPNTV